MISSGQPPEMLISMNSIIRRIDLSCNLLAPVFSGFIISFISLKASALSFALWNTVAVWLQYWLLNSVYNGIPALYESSQRREANGTVVDRLDDHPTSTTDVNAKKLTFHWLHKFLQFDAWVVYFNQEVVLPGIALALLYFTVLRFCNSFILHPLKTSIYSLNT